MVNHPTKVVLFLHKKSVNRCNLPVNMICFSAVELNQVHPQSAIVLRRCSVLVIMSSQNVRLIVRAVVLAFISFEEETLKQRHQSCLVPNHNTPSHSKPYSLKWSRLSRLICIFLDTAFLWYHNANVDEDDDGADSYSILFVQSI